MLVFVFIYVWVLVCIYCVYTLVMYNNKNQLYNEIKIVVNYSNIIM